MLCEHLFDLELTVAAAGIDETYRGQSWSQNCREWVYYDCLLDVVAIRESFDLALCVVDHRNDDPKRGLESGFVCGQCHDALLGVHPQNGKGRRVFPGAKN